MSRIFVFVCLVAAAVAVACSDKTSESSSEEVKKASPKEAMIGVWTLDQNHSGNDQKTKENVQGLTITPSAISLKFSGNDIGFTISRMSVDGSSVTLYLEGHDRTITVTPDGDSMVFNGDGMNFHLIRDKNAKLPSEKEHKAAGDEGRRRVLTREASMNLRKLFDGAISYYQKDHIIRGQMELLPKQFPVSAEFPPHDLWHKTVCPSGGKPAKYMPRPNDWQDATWQRLDFAIGDPWRFKYTFISKGTGAGAAFTVRATGDLDCDGVFSTFERIGRVNAENEIDSGNGMYVDKELE